MPATAVSSWFADDFANFHPLLQHLHRTGGLLSGAVTLAIPTGLAGWVGRRLASKMGIPAAAGVYPFDVIISHEKGRLIWSRRFAERNTLVSVFEPVGDRATGYWREATGNVELQLQVDILNGGWHWRCVAMRWNHVPLPLWIAPRTRAYKEIEGDQYRFYVGFSLPLLGTVLSYSGLLAARVSETAHTLPEGVQ